MDSLLKGYLFALSGVFILSPDALLVRLIGGDPFLINVWRGLIGGLVILILSCFLDKRSLLEQMRPAGYGSFAVILCHAGSQVAFVFAISHANVAHVLVIIAFTPLVSAFLSALFLAETVHLRTWVAALICGIGLTVLFLQPSTLMQINGIWAAMICAVLIAISFVVMRAFPKANFAAAVGLGSILAGLSCSLLAASLMPAVEQWLPLLVMALVVSPLPFVMFVLALRHISAAETSLVILLESVLGSLWVWLVLTETPSVQTLLAGLLILTTLTVHSLLVLKAKKSKI